MLLNSEKRHNSYNIIIKYYKLFFNKLIFIFEHFYEYGFIIPRFYFLSVGQGESTVPVISPFHSVPSRHYFASIGLFLTFSNSLDKRIENINNSCYDYIKRK